MPPISLFFFEELPDGLIEISRAVPSSASPRDSVSASTVQGAPRQLLIWQPNEIAPPIEHIFFKVSQAEPQDRTCHLLTEEFFSKKSMLFVLARTHLLK
jgi:hypothetical protein